MTGDLLINTNDAYDTWGVSMGEGFISNIDTPAQMKDYVKNVSRAEHGSQYVVSSPYMAEREVTLPFIILGVTEADFRAKRDAFINVLQAGKVTVEVPCIGVTYNLIYQGKNITYSLNRSRTLAKMQAKFVEPDPSDRTVVELTDSTLTTVSYTSLANSNDTEEEDA